MPRRIRSSCHRRSIAFTMIELLVVIVILALLIALITAVSSKVIRQQKVRNTEQIMQNVTLAIDQFVAADPLHEVYGKKDKETFGKYPPYQLANANPPQDDSVAQAIEQTPPGPALGHRLRRDMGDPGAPIGDYVVLPDQGDGNDDNRALYAYLRVFSPDSIRVIPEDALKPIDPKSPDYVNPTGGTLAIGVPGNTWIDVLGIHDAWGVPLDYMLYVKCEWRMTPTNPRPIWVVTERRPVLRSRGIKREVYDVWVGSNPTDARAREGRLSPADKWLFSEPFCSPVAGLTDSGTYIYPPYRYRDGILPGTPSPANAADGWARAVAYNEDYAYRPEGDTPE